MSYLAELLKGKFIFIVTEACVSLKNNGYVNAARDSWRLKA